MNSTSLLGISFPEENFKSVISQCQKTWANQGRLHIATVNPEFLVETERNTKLKANTQATDIQVVDGFGLWLALKLRGWQGVRITGVDLVEKLLAVAEQEKKSALIILKSGGLSSLVQTKEALLKRYPQLTVTVMYDTEAGSVSNLVPDCIFIATGIPSQEYLGEQYQRGVIIGVGGAIDFLTGAQKRAPKIVQSFGLEWLWRLLHHPKRILRIWNAVVVFPTLVLFDKKKS
jgi:N-acetylglucosaminyldiphosphoundecaprenol N-acetyl-beta-D-mannosaminyltransferase